MLIKNRILNKVLAVSSAMAMIVNPTNAAPTRTRVGMRAESLSLESRDVPAVANVKDEISSLIGDASSLNADDLLVKFIAQSSAPTHDSMHGCVQAKDDMDLRILIANASEGNTILLCPGKVTFSNEIELTKSITISCAGPTGSCIFDGNEATRHFASILTDGKTFAFIDLTFINGLANDDSVGGGAEGGSLLLAFGSTTILTGCVFYNNRATFSSGNAAGGAIYATGVETVVNNCLFLDNIAETTAAGGTAFGGAIDSVNVNLKVTNSIFKNNKALSTDLGGGGAISTFNADVLVLSSVFELNEASSVGGAARFDSASVDWYNNKDLLFGNDAGEDCDGVKVVGEDCFSVGDNFAV